MRRNYIYGQSPLLWSPPQAVLGLGSRASSIAIPIYGELKPAVTAISQTADITPVTIYDSVVTVTPDMYGNAVQLSQKVQLISIPDVLRVAAEEVAMNAAESRDYLARSAAVAGTVVGFGGDATARASLSTAATSDGISLAKYFDAVSFLEGTRAPKIPGPGAGFAAIMRKNTVLDTLMDSNIVLVAEYSPGQGPSLLNGEIGTHIAGVRIVESNNAKIFQGAGASASDFMSTTGYGTLATAAAAGSTTLTLSASSKCDVGDYYTVGGQESTTAGEISHIETIRITGSTGTTPTFIGGDPRGGLLFAHSSGETLYPNFGAYATLFMGADALLGCYTNEDGLGPDGIIYPPEQTGMLRQFTNVAWKGFWGFGRVSEGRLYRLEHVCSRQVVGK